MLPYDSFYLELKHSQEKYTDLWCQDNPAELEFSDCVV